MPEDVDAMRAARGGGDVEPLCAADGGDEGSDRARARRGHAHAQAARPQGLDDAGQGRGSQQEATPRAILLHGAAEGGLSVAREAVDLVQHHDLVSPPLPRHRVHWPRARHVLDDFLHHVAVVHARVRGAELDVVVGGGGGEFQLNRAGGSHHFPGRRLHFDAVGARAKHFAQGGFDEGGLARARGAVEEGVGAVAGGDLCVG